MTQLSLPRHDDGRDVIMPYVPRAEVSRIHVKDLTDLARLKKISDFQTRFLVLIFIAVFDLVATQIYRRDTVPILFISCVVAIFLMARLDVVRLRWLLAEVLGSRRLSYAVPADPDGENLAHHEPVSVLKIQVGDLICTRGQHREMTEVAEQQPQQWRGQGLGRWYSPVLAVGTGSGKIKLGVLGCEEPYWEDDPEEEKYFKRKRPLHPIADSRGSTEHSIEVATALAGLLDFLSAEADSEDEVARFVASKYRCSDWAVRNAISVALAAKLAARKPSPAIVLEVPRLFAKPVKLGGHRACRIRLTPLGQLWQESGPFVRGAEPVGAGTDRDLLRQGRRIAMSMIQPSQTLPAGGIAGEEELLAFVHEMIEKFRHFAENESGWRLFWESDHRHVVHEDKMQLLFLGVLKGYFERAGLRLDREVETGRGPVDFTVSGDRRVRVLIEMKKLSHTAFWHGLKIQTPIYMYGQEVRSAIFLAIRDSDTGAARERWEKLQEEAVAIRAVAGLAIEIERIDVLPKPSASEA